MIGRMWGMLPLVAIALIAFLATATPAQTSDYVQQDTHSILAGPGGAAVEFVSLAPLPKSCQAATCFATVKLKRTEFRTPVRQTVRHTATVITATAKETAVRTRYLVRRVACRLAHPLRR